MAMLGLAGLLSIVELLYDFCFVAEWLSPVKHVISFVSKLSIMSD